VIVVDPSILLCVLLDEAQASVCDRFLRDAGDDLVISAASYVEAFIAGERRSSQPGGGRVVEIVLQSFKIFPVPFDLAQAAWAVEGYERFGRGKGSAPSALNLGDCYSYGLAKSLGAPLAFVGRDFLKSDVTIAAIPGLDR
jgi:ribonuclease VapC